MVSLKPKSPKEWSYFSTNNNKADKLVSKKGNFLLSLSSHILMDVILIKEVNNDSDMVPARYYDSDSKVIQHSSKAT